MVCGVIKKGEGVSEVIKKRLGKVYRTPSEIPEPDGTIKELLFSFLLPPSTSPPPSFA